MTDTTAPAPGPISPVDCTVTGCLWAVHGIPDRYPGLRGTALRQHLADDHEPTPADPTGSDGDPCAGCPTSTDPESGCCWAADHATDTWEDRPMTDTAPLTDQQLRDRIDHAMRAAVSLPTLPPVTEHGKHRYELGCALCHGDVAILTNAVLAVVQPEVDRLRAEVEHWKAEFREAMDNYHGEYNHAQKLRIKLAEERSVNGHLVEKHTATLMATDEWMEERARLLADNHQQAAELDRLRAENGRLLGFIERGFDTHMRFNVAHLDGTIEELPCADWCRACKLQRAEAEADRLRAVRDERTQFAVDVVTELELAKAEAARLRAELTATQKQLAEATTGREGQRARLWLIEQTLAPIDIQQDPAGIAGMVGPYLDGPLHPDDLAAYRAASDPTT